MADITLSAGVRQNLLSLQGTSDMMSQTQNRLATGKEVNSALDNPSNFFTSQSLSSRANEMSSLLDSMANGVKTLEAADNGLSSITNTLESMQSTLRQARQDKTFQTESYTADENVVSGDQISFSGGAVGETAVAVELASATSAVTGSGFTDFDISTSGTDEISFDISVNGGASETISLDDTDFTNPGEVTADDFAAVLNSKFDSQSVDATASVDGGEIVITGASTTESEADVTINSYAETLTNGTTGIVDGSGTDTLAAKTTDALVSEINSNSSLDGKIRASNDDGKLRIENQSTQELAVDGVTSGGAIDGTTTGAATIEGNSVRSGLADQFNELKDQLDKLSDDASYNGVNLLRGDNLKITFNETGTSTIDIQTEDGETINAANLGLNSIEAKDLDSDAQIDDFLTNVKGALNDISSQSSTFGSNLSIVENRQDFTKSMVNTLETGADNLVLADMNEEAANMMALQTRQQLSSSALSLASQSDQNVLQLLR